MGETGPGVLTVVMSTTFGERLKKARNRRRASQEDVARAIGVFQSTVSGWEANDKLPETANLLALSDDLRVSLDYLARGVRDEFSPWADHPDYEAAQRVANLVHPTELLQIIVRARSAPADAGANEGPTVPGIRIDGDRPAERARKPDGRRKAR
jgi:transcriptional regulator with XRE-family HTH domain